MKKEMLKYNVILVKDVGGYTVTAPALPGCISQGETVEEATEHIKEAIELYLEVLAEDGETDPRDTNIISSVIEVATAATPAHA